MARLLDGRVTLVAPDLRGRAGSSALPGPYGIAAHADDAAAVAAALGGPGRVVLAGHSMGAFVAALAAVRHPERFGPLLLVDGGIGFPAPTHLSPDELLTAVIGPAMDRLSMTFPDRAAYRSFWRAHPAFADAWSDEVDAYVQRDLTGEEPALRSSCRIEAVRADGIGLFGEEVLAAVRELPVPATLLWARRGLMDEEQGLYDEGLPRRRTSGHAGDAGRGPGRQPLHAAHGGRGRRGDRAAAGGAVRRLRGGPRRGGRPGGARAAGRAYRSRPPASRCRRRASCSSRARPGSFQSRPSSTCTRSSRCTTVLTCTWSSSLARTRLPPDPK